MASYPGFLSAFLLGQETGQQHRAQREMAALIDQIRGTYGDGGATAPAGGAGALLPMLTGATAAPAPTSPAGAPLDIMPPQAAAEPPPAFSFGEHSAQTPPPSLLDQLLGEPRSIAGQMVPQRPVGGMDEGDRARGARQMGGTFMQAGAYGPSNLERFREMGDTAPLPGVPPPETPGLNPARQPERPVIDPTRQLGPMTGTAGADLARGDAGTDRLAPAGQPAGFVQFQPQGQAGGARAEPPGFDRIIQLESGGKHTRRDGTLLRSPAGAVGIAQVMPGTGPEAARLAGLPWDERLFYDPGPKGERYNRALGAAYYGEQLRRFGGDQVKAAAAYNAGPERARQHYEQGRPLPGETQRYVAAFSGSGGSDTLTGQAGGDTLQPGGANGAQGSRTALQALLAAQGTGQPDPMAERRMRLLLELASVTARGGNINGALSLLGTALGDQSGGAAMLIPLPDGTIIQRTSGGNFSTVWSPPDQGTPFSRLDADTIFDARTGETREVGGGSPGYRMLSADEKAQMGLPAAGAYQVDREGKVSQVGGGGTSVSITNLPPGANTPLGQTAQNTLQGKAINTLELGARLDQIAASFKPEYLTLGEQAANTGRRWTEWALGADSLSPEGQQALTDYTTFKTQTVQNLNQYISEISGAAVSVQEADRLNAALPTMDDSPTEFAAKLVTIQRQVRLALARYNYLLRNGLPTDPSQMPLGQFQAEAERREAEVRSELQAQHPNATPEQIDEMGAVILREEFGL